MELLELELVPVILAVQSSHENLQEMFLLSTYLKKLCRKKNDTTSAVQQLVCTYLVELRMLFFLLSCRV